MMHRLWFVPALFAALALAATLSGCGIATEAAESPLETREACIRSAESNELLARLTVEIADTSDARKAGLMGRRELADDRGMLFVYQEERPADAGFWMYRTLIPLEIAFIGPDGDIRNTREMLPCTGSDRSNCPIYRAGTTFLTALEVNPGFLARHNVHEGDRFIWSTTGCQD